jgi:sugar lactone lactonase YvrE
MLRRMSRVIPAAMPFLFFLAGCSGNVPDAPSEPRPDAHVETEPATVLVTDPHVAPELLLSLGTLFWIDRGLEVTDSIHAVPAAGGDTKEIYRASPGSAAIEALAADAENVYFTEVWGQSVIHADLKSVPRAGGEARVLWSEEGVTLGLAVDDGNVYFGASTASVTGVLRVPVAGGKSELVAASTASPGPSSVAVNSTGVYWVDLASGNLMRLAPSAAQPVVVADAEDVLAYGTPLALTGSELYWGSNGGVMGVGLARGETRSVAKGLDTAGSIVADASAVYWIDQPATGSAVLRKVALSTDGTPGASSIIAEGLQVMGELVPQGLALDGTFVYWAASGKVSRARR